jgi:hypothetical protein
MGQELNTERSWAGFVGLAWADQPGWTRFTFVFVFLISLIIFVLGLQMD